MNIETLKQEILDGRRIGKEEALFLCREPLEPLCRCADEIRRRFCRNEFDLCTIINGKSGRCTEDCRFCAQSARHSANAPQYPLLSAGEIVRHAKEQARQGILRYSIVTSGKRLSDGEIDQLCETVRQIRQETSLAVCVSSGLQTEAQYHRLKEAGVSRIHNNLEASRSFFPKICTTHTFDDKVRAIRAAQAAGLSVCSGGIMGLGESFADRIDLALSLRSLGIQSIPLNMLNPIPGTPLAQNPQLTTEEMCRIAAVFRFLLPDASIRLAGGRGLMADKGRSCFQSGANAAISGDMLTTAGITVKTDLCMLHSLGYVIKRCNN